MKLYIRKIASLLMALLVLFSTFSFTIESHYCNDVLVDFSLFGEAESCGMEVQQTPISGCEITKKNCCSNKQLVNDGQVNEKDTTTSISKTQQLFIVSYIFKSFHHILEPQTDINFFREYVPLPKDKDVQVLYQTFII